MLRILQICPDYPRGSGILVGNIWDSLEAVKSQIVWDFSNMKTRLKDNESNNSVLESLWQIGKFCLLLNFVALGNLQLLVSSPCTHLGAENSK